MPCNMIAHLHCIFRITFYFRVQSRAITFYTVSGSMRRRRSIIQCVLRLHSHTANTAQRSILNEIAMQKRKVSSFNFSNAGANLVSLPRQFVIYFTSLPIVIGIHWANCEKIFFPLLILPLELSVFISMECIFSVSLSNNSIQSSCQ